MSACTMLLLAILDYQTGFEISFSFLYLIPITIATMFVGFEAGIIITILSIFLWILTNWLAGEDYSHSVIWIWNASVRLITFIAISYLIHELNLAIEHGNILSRTDFLTGVNNSREFYRLAEIEFERARRHKRPISVIHFDLDNFKQVNDVYGHSTGDELLRNVAQMVVSVVRKGDLFSRLGGDEFALLLPETNQVTIQAVAQKVHSAIVGVLAKTNLNVTASMGVVTYTNPPVSVEEMLKEVDQVMYQVKNNTKNGIMIKNVGLQTDREIQYNHEEYGI